MTVAQRRFAQLAAQGEKLTDAHIMAYGPGKRKNKHEAASRLAKKPEIREAIERFADELLPIGDLRQARERMLSNIEFLAKNARDEKVRLAASVDLRNYCDERLKLEEPIKRSITIDALVQEIRELDAAEPTIELEAVDEAAATLATEDQAE